MEKESLQLSKRIKVRIEEGSQPELTLKVSHENSTDSSKNITNGTNMGSFAEENEDSVWASSI
jgi:hypothetical protein